jgi:hypothetical protein
MANPHAGTGWPGPGPAVYSGPTMPATGAMVTDRFSDLTTYLLPAAAALAGLALGLIARRTVLGALARIARRSTWKYDDVLVEALRGPVVAWGTLAGLSAAVALLRLPDTPTRVLDQILLVLAILSVTWAAARFTA